jgi:hypothetical protein
MNFFKEVSDTYNRRARLYPGFAIMLPLSLLAIVLAATKPTWWSSVVSVLGVSGVSYLGAQLVRSAGRRNERDLWAGWGGAPTTQMLRFRSAPNKLAVQRRHDQLTRLLPDLFIPDEATELADPAAADQCYETATRAIIERTRDKERFERVFDELCQYGFRRNFWGCRKCGLWLAGLGLLAAVVLGTLELLGILKVSRLGLLVSAGVDVLLLVVLGAVVRPDWVRESAEAYAQQLIASLETLTAVEA